ncbi:phosphatidylinositol N-acetylglucosaminyltransferase subunit Q-like isoform X2 [Prorops nasuta]|uniref:phosphatidylinositol N-acetylglucosaminyltransferase subunit Q-like isoform X2 n=1 Tax=Prorops nasuta TaxID=863751 RepID=UPI0034CF048D
MKNLLIFIPISFSKKKSGYIFGKIVQDVNKDVIKFSESTATYSEKQSSEWIDIYLSKNISTNNYEYDIKNIIINGEKVLLTFHHIFIITYDKLALEETELFSSRSSKQNHFYELRNILQNHQVKEEIQRKSGFNSIKNTLITYHAFLCFYPVVFLTKAMNKLMPLLRYSSLGLHIIHWLENMKWMLMTIMQNKRLTLKTGNYISTTIFDMLLGIFVLKFLLNNIMDIAPSIALLNNAEHVVEALKSLIDWLMGAPAGLKLNYMFNTILGKFFLYNIHLWWTFLLFIQPVMDFAFNVLFLFGNLGITFQISIAADLLSLISFHSYCIYVYAARLFSVQLRGLTALFRLFVGKKKNPLRQRIDTCEYQPDQLFIGTLLFTILLFLMPTTWVYYTVFTLFRLILVGFSGFLTRLKFYLQVIPFYATLKWLLGSNSVKSIIDLRLGSCQPKKPITLFTSMTVSSWAETWNRSIPDTISIPPQMKWKKIINDMIWGQLF